MKKFIIPDTDNSQYEKTTVEYNNFISDNEIESWKEINNFPNYHVSTLGRIKVVKSDRSSGINKILKPSIRSGYFIVTLWNGKKKKTLKIHRIVAQTYIVNTNIKKFKIIDHINGNRLDNRVINLRWCTYSQNSKHRFKTNYQYKGVPILQYDLEGNLIKEWENIRKIIEENKTYKYGSLLHCLAGSIDKLYGYKWEYKKVVTRQIIDDEEFKIIGKIGKYDFSDYKISNYGNVLNKKSKLIKLTIDDNGYVTVRMRHKNSKKDVTYYVHRLVAISFVDGRTDKRNFVNHKDENRQNNHYKNLEWLTNRKNIIYSVGKKVNQIDKNTGEIINTFTSLLEACEFNNFHKNRSVSISHCCKNKRPSAYGYKWEYV